ncbi:MAG: lipid-A-disaccharide synthase [Alphaproteobacteria bacterium]
MADKKAKLGIIAGGGEIPVLLAKACLETGRDFFVLALKEQADLSDFDAFPYEAVSLGEAEKGFKYLKEAEVQDVVFIGKIKRPSLAELKPDKRAAQFLARVGFKMLGDDNLLSAVIKEFELEGFGVVGVHDIMSELLAPKGCLTKTKPDDYALNDITQGIRICKTIGALDVGQSVIVQEGMVLGVEAIEGTDELIKRAGKLRRKDAQGGVLVKLKKPQQENRIDLPTIGIKTVENAAKAGLRGIAIEAFATLIVGQEKVIKKADDLGVFIKSLSREDIHNAEKKDPRIFIVAGEPSGDLIASRLMKALKEETKGRIKFAGVGGESMKAEGFKSLFDIKSLAVMGLLEVIPSIPKVLSLIRKTVKEVEKLEPDIVITVDSWSFSGRVNALLAKKGNQIPRVHYVAPQVWAWKAGRAKTMGKYTDLLLTLLPSEPAYFTKYGLETCCVGHPVIEGGAASGNAKAFLKQYNLSKKDNIITMLPGSRHNEVSRLMPVFKETAEILSKEISNLKIVIPSVATVSDEVKKEAKTWEQKPIIVIGEKERYDAFAASAFAIAASGTVALELAMAGVPHLITYKVAPLTAVMAKKLLKIKYVNLINIILDKLVVPELLQDDCNKARISEETLRFLEDKKKQKEQVLCCQNALYGLSEDKDTPSLKAARIILSKIL